MESITKEVILSTINKKKNKVRSFGVKRLVLFGSYARDKQKDNSDIDFLVEFDKARGNYRDALDLLHFLEDTFNRKIDIGDKNTLREELKPYIMESIQYEATI